MAVPPISAPRSAHCQPNARTDSFIVSRLTPPTPTGFTGVVFVSACIGVFLLSSGVATYTHHMSYVGSGQAKERGKKGERVSWKWHAPHAANDDRNCNSINAVGLGAASGNYMALAYSKVATCSPLFSVAGSARAGVQRRSVPRTHLPALVPTLASPTFASPPTSLACWRPTSSTRLCQTAPCRMASTFSPLRGSSRRRW